MVRAVGIDAGEFEVKVVELDGSYRRPRLVKVSFEVVAQHRAPDAKGGPTGAPDAVTMATAVRAALDQAKAARENLNLGFQAREAVLRTLPIPFATPDQIRKVVKFEAEGAIHSHQVDDMVVDFYVQETRDNQSRVLVAAVPKPPLRALLGALETRGLEPESVGLDLMALFRLSEWLGLCAPPAKPKGEELPVAAATREPARVILDLGARTIRALVVAGGRILDLRALRTGADAILEEVAAGAGVEVAKVRDAVQAALRTGEDFVVDLDAPPKPEAEAEGGAVPAPVQTVVGHQLVEQATQHFLERVRRELTRFLTAIPNLGPIEGVWVTGGGTQVPGMDAALQEVFDVAPQPLDVLGSLSHGLTKEDARRVGPRIAVAVGLALAMLGGESAFNFRQEDLAFRRRFDRIKFPLAITCMFALFLVVVYAMKLNRELDVLRRDYGETAPVTAASGPRGTQTGPQFYGLVGYLLNSGGWFSTPSRFDPKEYKELLNTVAARPVFERLAVIRGALQNFLTKRREQMGDYKELRLESGYAVVVRATEILDRMRAELGRFLVAEAELKVPAGDRGRYLRLVLALRGDDFRDKYQRIERAFRADAALPDSPFAELGKATDEKIFKNTDEPGAYMEIRVELKKEIPVFKNTVPQR
ncbi:MAG: pilus assembly protein PilM [Planctomycetes bacterium]|nr:pilus assembly protein PilM [Planctomycetota bacterium]